MPPVSLTQYAGENAGQTIPARLTWRGIARALRGDALGAFPAEAFVEDVVVQNFLGRQHILLQRPDAIRRVLIDNAGNYARLPAVLRVLRPMFGGGLFLSTGREWRRQRREVAPAFAPRTIQFAAPRIVGAARALAANLATAERQPVDIVPRLQRLALDIIGGAIFSLDMAAHTDELRDLILHYAMRLGRPSLADFLLPLAVPTPADFARARFRRRWRALIDRIIAERAARLQDAAPEDLFDILATPGSAGAPPDAETLGDQVATIVVAGHETTAAALFWSLYLLAQHREVQDRVAAEVARWTPNPENAAEILPQLTYVRAVIDEALRLYPPAFVIVRRALGEDVAGGVRVAKGALVLVAPWILHRHRRFWEAPQRFDPSRFLPGAPPPPRYVYMPFGAGPRTCVGAPFALSELVLVIATLVRSLQVGLMPHRPVVPVGRVTLQPDSPPPFVFRPRES